MKKSKSGKAKTWKIVQLFYKIKINLIYLIFYFIM